MGGMPCTRGNRGTWEPRRGRDGNNTSKPLSRLVPRRSRDHLRFVLQAVVSRVSDYRTTGVLFPANERVRHP